MDKAKVRIEEFDMLKGIGMLMVIIGHSFHVWPLYHAFYQIHMPLFFIASGYFFSVKTVDWGGYFGRTSGNLFGHISLFLFPSVCSFSLSAKAAMYFYRKHS